MDDKEIEGYIMEINSDIRCLLTKFHNFRKLNVIEESLCRNLQDLVSCVDEFIDSNPQDLRLDKNCENITLDSHGIVCVLECSPCKSTFNQKNLIKHVESWSHIQNISQKFPRIDIKFSSNSYNDANLFTSSSSENIYHDQDFRSSIQEKKKLQIEPESQPTASSSSLDFDKNSQFRLSKLNILQSQTDFDKFLSYVENFKPIDIDAECSEFNDKFCSTVSVFNTYPNLKLHFHGPRSYGLHDMLSVQDVYCDTGNEYYYYPGPTESDIKYKIERITECLYDDPNCNWIYSIEDRKYDSTVLQIEMENHPIKYLLTFVNGLQCSKSRIISYMFSLEWKSIKSYLVLVKAIQDQDLLTAFNPDVIAQIVIYYFQTFGMLPFIEYLQTSVEPNYIGPWQVNFHRLRSEDEFPYTKFKMTRNWIMVLRRLLNELSHFKFNQFIMCPYLGKKLSQDTQFIRMKEFYRYHNYLRNIRDAQPLTFNQICIQDFIQLNKNITDHIWVEELQKFKKCLIRLSSAFREHVKSSK